MCSHCSSGGVLGVPGLRFPSLRLQRAEEGGDGGGVPARTPPWRCDLSGYPELSGLGVFGHGRGRKLAAHLTGLCCAVKSPSTQSTWQGTWA